MAGELGIGYGMTSSNPVGDAWGGFKNVIQTGGDAAINATVDFGRNFIQGMMDDEAEAVEKRKAGGWTQFYQELTDTAGRMVEGATAGRLDIAAEGLIQGSNYLPEQLKAPAIAAGFILGSVDGSVPKLKSSALNKLGIRTRKAVETVNTVKPTTPKNIRVIKDANKDINEFKRTEALIRASAEDSAVNHFLGGSAEEIQTGLLRLQGDIAPGAKGLNTPAHHIGMLGTFDIPQQRMGIAKGTEVNNILADKYNIRLGQEKENLITLFSQRVHNKVAHAGNYQDRAIRESLSRVNWEKLSPEEAADSVAKHYWIAQNQAWAATVHPVNVKAAWDLYEAIPDSLRKALPSGFNPLTTDYNTPEFKEFRILLENLNPAMKKQLLETRKVSELSFWQSTRNPQ
tara:strand:+ start:591 stop:1790 length:1200 start_codon:yes stop_codon:yes gene_type:complete